MKFQGFQTGVNQRGSFSGVGRGVGDAQQILASYNCGSS